MGHFNLDELSIGSVASFVMMCISAVTLIRAINASKQSRSEKDIRDNYKLDALAQRFDELNALLHSLTDGYASNEKRISLLERNDSRQDKRLAELEGRLCHIIDEVLPNIGR